MAKFVKGDVVVVPFPFSDLTTLKRRPALVIAELEGDDLILCQITSKATKDSYTLLLEDNDFAEVGLHQSSNIRPNRIFTADSHIVIYKVGHLVFEKINIVTDKVISILRN
jgi:mRNA interferase MazF